MKRLKMMSRFLFFDVFSVVVTHQKIQNIWGEKALFTKKSPKEIIEILRKKGFENILLGGGGKTNAAFMKAGLVDEIYLDVEPIVFGKGIRLFEDEDFSYDLELLEINKLSEKTVQLHYKILK